MSRRKVKENENLKNRMLVVKLRLSGKTYKEIQKQTGRSKSYVQRWVDRFNKNGTVTNLRRETDKMKISQAIKKKIVATVKFNHHASCRIVAKKLQTHGYKVSKSSVHRTLKEEGYKNVMPKKKPYLTKQQQQTRLNFARKLQTKNLTFWKRIIFSDESPFEQGGNSSKIWIPINKPTPVIPTKKFPFKIQVWGAVGWKSKTPLYLIEAGKRLTSEGYQDILRTVLVPNIKKISCQPALLLQDGASCHTAKKNKNFLKENKIKLISGYPSQSPDLNVIENIWSMIKRNIDLSKASTSEEMFDIIEKEWNNLSQGKIKKIIQSMPRRIDAIVQAKGSNTKY